MPKSVSPPALNNTVNFSGGNAPINFLLYGQGALGASSINSPDTNFGRVVIRPGNFKEQVVTVYNLGSVDVPGALEVPLALPNNIDMWAYDVIGKESLDTPFGPIETFHLRPTRERPSKLELVADAWFAPSLQYLPIRLLIRQDEATYVDMMIERLPLQAAPASARNRRCCVPAWLAAVTNTCLPMACTPPWPRMRSSASPCTRP